MLKTIAAGNHKLGKIATTLEVSQTSLTSYIKTLIDLDIIEREVPITEENPEKSKMGLYRIKDNFIEFWFKYVYPNRSLIESGQMQYVEDKIRQHFFDNHVAYVYEDICRNKVWELLSEGISINRAGRWWGAKDVEIDIVAYDAMGNDIVFGECKYSKNQKGMDVLRALQEKSKNVNWNKTGRREHFIIFSKSGFTEELLKYASDKPTIILRTF